MRNLSIVNPNGLNQDQDRIAKDIAAWYKSDKLFYTLSGQAGTGKTYLTNYLLRNVFINSTCITAPTHKALKVIEEVTGKKGKTLQALHGLRPNVNLEDFNVDKVQFDPLATSSFGNYKIILIDEGSQVSRALHKLNEMRAKEYKTKVIYIGDRLQLAPIKEQESCIFTLPYRGELTQIVRQESSNPLLTLFKLLRHDIMNNGGSFLDYIATNPVNINEQGEGYICVNEETFKTEIINTFKSKAFERNVRDFVRYAAYTNESVNMWNTFIRNNTLNNHEDIVGIDDLLTGYRTIMDEYNSPVIINSEDYIVEDISKKMSDDNFAVFNVVFRSLLDGRTVAAYIVDHEDPTFSRFVNIIQTLHFNALYSNKMEKGKNWKKYFQYKERFNVLKPFIVNGIEDRTTTIPKDIDYGYGSTVHKLQGSTIQHIFINLLDICYYKGDKRFPIVNTSKQPYAIETRNKLLYTAISRARKIAVIMV